MSAADDKRTSTEEKVKTYTDLILNSPAAKSLNLDPTVLLKDILAIVESEENHYPALVQYLTQYLGIKNEPSDFPMTFQETSELVSILPPRAPKELVVILKRREDGRLKVVYDGEIDVATTAGRKE